MTNNTKIFSEAIAEAKAIRETAMANAKLALEEAFAPRIQEMMSDKLEALAEEEMEEGYGSEETQNEEISLEELLAELDGLEEGEDNDADDMMEENTIAEAEADDEVGTISVDELKDIIRDIMADVMGGGEEMEAGEEEGEEEVEGGEEMSAEDDLELEEILAEIASLEEGEEEMEEGLKDFAKKAGEKIKSTVGPGGSMEKWIDKTGEKMKKAGIASPYGANHPVNEEAEEIEEGMDAWIDKISAKLQKLGKNSKTVQAIEKAISKYETEPHSGANRIAEESEELEEAMNTIATLRSELNEVNLLNAKLLYVNKLFKAKNLNESQKVKVINAFDRAETVREAKNVYDTLSESLTTEKAKSQIKESLSFASKAAGVADRQPIVEGNDFINRMQKLAGII